MKTEIRRLLAVVVIAWLGGGCVTIQVPRRDNTNVPSNQVASRTPHPSTPATVNSKTISAEMTDEQILAAFDVDIQKAKSDVSKGPDGSSTTYKFAGQAVSITRSVVTGVYVFAYGEPIKGEWKLGGGN